MLSIYEHLLRRGARMIEWADRLVTLWTCGVWFPIDRWVSFHQHIHIDSRSHQGLYLLGSKTSAAWSWFVTYVHHVSFGMRGAVLLCRLHVFAERWMNTKEFSFCCWLIHFIRQWLYKYLMGPGLFFMFVIFFTQTVELLGGGISPSQGGYLHRTTQTGNKRTHRHPCFEWDSNPLSQHPSEQRQFMP
jgi:hypothetical protein